MDVRYPNPAGVPLVDLMASIPEFRIDRRKKHSLCEMLTIAALSVICGGTGPTDFARFARSKFKWLRGFLRLENGVPSHDTFRRIFMLLSPACFNAVLVEWLRSVADVAGGLISIDGKSIRRALTKDGKMPCIVSAYAGKGQLVVAQVKANEKSNEITAIPILLEMLYISGSIVTIDAAGCQKNIARKIISKDADYMLSLKGNQANMHDEIALFFEDALRSNPRAFRSATTTDCERGLTVTRVCHQSDDLEWFADRGKWPGLRSVCRVKTTTYRKATRETTVDVRYFISSLPVNPKRALKAIRGHWGVESMHWTLDMVFDEDHSRARTGHAAENLAILRHLVINLLRLDKTLGGGITKKRKELMWNDETLFRFVKAA